jgi:hypothetical protein
MTVQVTKLPVQRELLKIRHNLLFKAWTDRDLVYIVNNVMYICTLAKFVTWTLDKDECNIEYN